MSVTTPSITRTLRIAQSTGFSSQGYLAYSGLCGFAFLLLFVLAGLLIPTLARAGDPLLEQQWHLKARDVEPGGANVRAAWPTTKGEGIVIGVIDDGLQYTHPDLETNYLPALSRDFYGLNDDDPAPWIGAEDCSRPLSLVGLLNGTDCHGTAVAGIAAATGDNNSGGRGVAPSAGLVGLRLPSMSPPYYGFHTDADEAAAFGHRSDAIHIKNNSWGPSDDGGTLGRPDPQAELAIETAIREGRSGKGTVFTWAAGNGAEADDNCNFDGYANSRYVIAVGATSEYPMFTWYGEPCTAMFVAAPSSGGSRGITTTDLLGSVGYSSTDYTDEFGGTSAATPVVRVR